MQNGGAGIYLNGAGRESPFSLEDLESPAPPEQRESSAAPQESERGNGSQGSKMSAPMAGDTLDSMDASDLWLDAGKQNASPSEWQSWSFSPD